MITSALPLVFVVAAIVVLAVTGNLFTSSPSPSLLKSRRGLERIGTALIPERHVSCVGGPWRRFDHQTGSVSRHSTPDVSAALLFIWAGVVSHLSVLTLAIGIAATIVAIVRVIAEERLLRAQYPEYHDYTRSTKALVPYVF